MKKFFLVLAILFCASLARAQGQGNTVMVFSGSAFSGACSGIMLGSDIVNGNLYWCAGPTYTWVKMSGATPTPTFTSVTAGSFISTGPGPWTTLTERANVITPASGFDICDQDSTAHGILCSFNGDTASLVTRQTAGSTNVNYVLHATAASGIYTPSAIAAGDLPTIAVNKGGTGQTTQAAAFAAIGIPLALGAITWNNGGTCTFAQ